MGFEALLRWRHPGKGLVPPDQFIPLAEEIGAIVPIGEWVLLTACTTAAGWPDGLKVAVNLSPVQFKSSNLVAAVSTALSSSGLVTAAAGAGNHRDGHAAGYRGHAGHLA